MLKIGEIAEAASCNTASIRYYEDIGLLPKADRMAGGHRVYGDDDLKRLRFIRRCRDFGFSIPQIRDLMNVSDGAPCAEIRGVAESRLLAVREKRRELQALEAALTSFVARCSTTCADGSARSCTIYEDLDAYEASL